MSTHPSNNASSSTGPATAEPALTRPSPTGPELAWTTSAAIDPNAGLGAGTDWIGGRSVEESFPYYALHTLPTQQLRVMSNKIFKVMDTDFPPADIADQYAALVEEISLRETQARNRSWGQGKGCSEDRPIDHKEPNLAFRDSPVARRFELYVDGTLAGYVKYQMHGGQVILLETIIRAGFSLTDSGIEETLIRRTFLNAHRRRLAIRVRCGRVRSFLAEYPQYRSLVPATAQHADTRII